MFDNDLEQSAVVLFLPLLLLAALPFVMAWLEEGLDGRPLRRPRVLPPSARIRSSARSHRPPWLHW